MGIQAILSALYNKVDDMHEAAACDCRGICRSHSHTGSCLFIKLVLNSAKRPLIAKGKSSTE
jgi:hypothetical protein